MSPMAVTCAYPLLHQRTDLELEESEASDLGMTSSEGGIRTLDYDMEHSKVEAWLDEHPEFFQVCVLMRHV
jgi:hypothetical protein